MADRFRAYASDGAVVATGDLSKDVAAFTAEADVAYVVFYSGPADGEVVAGKVDIDPPKRGAIKVELAEVKG